MRARLVRTSLPLGSRRAFTAPALAALVLTTAACGPDPDSGALKPRGSGGQATAPAQAPTASAPAMTPQQVDQLVLKRYREYLRVYKQAFASNDPSRLADVASDPLLSTVSKEVESTKARGEVWRFTLLPNPKVYGRSQDGLTVYVIDCLRTLSASRFSVATGRRLGREPASTYAHRSAVRFEAGVWKVSDTERERAC
ncbi:hypothetical protein [Spirillospora sp. NPDC047279]|uniref:hypothetical protein n=1 Tax=Spirillospora sp. NPDC047279 TaxID=3155478 RepID=UPI0033F779A5